MGLFSPRLCFLFGCLLSIIVPTARKWLISRRISRIRSVHAPKPNGEVFRSCSRYLVSRERDGFGMNHENTVVNMGEPWSIGLVP